MVSGDNAYRNSNSNNNYNNNLKMIRLNEVTLGASGGTGFIFGAITTQNLIEAFILGLAGALGGLIINIIYRIICKKFKLK